MGDPTGRISHLPDMHRGVSWKQPVRCATTASVTIATALNAGDSIDGVTLAAGDRVLVKNQGTASQNGIYVVGASPARAFDMDQDTGDATAQAEEVLGAFVYVIEGTANGGKLFYATNTSAPTLGSTSLAFAEFASASDTSLVTVAATGATETVDVSVARTYDLTLNANCTLTLSGAVTAEAWFVTIIARMDGSGGWTLTWPGSVEWPGGVTPTIDDAADAVNVFTLFTLDGGTTWFGFPTGGAGGASALDDLTDVTITTPATGDRVRYNGSAWVNSPALWVPVMVEDGATGLWYVAVTGDGDAVMTEVS